MWYDVLMGSEGYRKIYLTATRNITRAANLARSTRTPWAVRNLFRVRARGRLQLLLLHGLVAAALLRCGATGPLDELINSPDPYVEELAWLGITLDYAFGTYLDHAESLIAEAYDEQSLEREGCGRWAPLRIPFDPQVLTLVAQALALVATHPRSERFFYPPPEPLVLIPTIQPNAPSA